MKFRRLSFVLLATIAFAVPAFAADLKIGLQDDPDVLDPDQARTFVGRIVFTGLCDKLVDVTPELKIVPQLATKWSWSDGGKVLTMELRKGVKFQDETPFNADAVAYNIDRSMHLKESRRKSELTSIEKVEAAGPDTVKIILKHPDATLLAQLADRSGMMMSPKALKAEGLKFGNDPVCSGPFKFVERVQQDHITLEKFKDYWNAKNIFLNKVTYVIIPDSTVRLANLRAGDLDLIERVAPTDVASVKKDANLKLSEAVSLGYRGVTVNINNGPSGNNPFGKSELLRQAFSLAVNRDALNQVVFNGIFKPGNQPFPPNSRWYDKALPIQKRNIKEAKALMKKAGHEHLTLSMMVPNNPQEMQVAQVIQAMVKPAGFDLKLRPMEFASLLSAQSAGNYQMSQIGWSGRVDPDGNIDQFVTCKGGINDAKYCNSEVDKLLTEARESNDDAKRKAKYDAAQAILMKDLPLIYLYHPTWIWAERKDVSGFVPYPDGMIRLEDVKKKG
jgi:peptide/nickel transport system substrate-binding protein